MLLAGLAVLGVAAGCGSVEVSASRDTAATTSAAEAAPTTQAASAPATTSDSGTGTITAAGPATTAAPVAVETRAEILLLAGPQLDGQQFDLVATAGNDVLLWFWAPW